METMLLCGALATGISLLCHHRRAKRSAVLYERYNAFKDRPETQHYLTNPRDNIFSHCCITDPTDITETILYCFLGMLRLRPPPEEELNQILLTADMVMCQFTAIMMRNGYNRWITQFPAAMQVFDDILACYDDDNIIGSDRRFMQQVKRHHPSLTGWNLARQLVNQRYQDIDPRFICRRIALCYHEHPLFAYYKNNPASNIFSHKNIADECTVQNLSYASFACLSIPDEHKTREVFTEHLGSLYCQFLAESELRGHSVPPPSLLLLDGICDNALARHHRRTEFTPRRPLTCYHLR
jgi:hypothetical protein